ncbi:MAG: DsbA family protein [Leeuwenhoekiella sp.]
MRFIIAFLFCFTTFITGNAQGENVELIYVMDPQCSWCYANSGNIEEIQEAVKDSMTIDFKAAGMWLDQEAPQGGASFFQRVTQHVPAMLSKTGARVGTAYYDLASDASYTFSSLEPSAAIVLVKKMAPEKTIEFAKMIERALFDQGKRLDEIATYKKILNELAIDSDSFEQNWMSEDNLKETRSEFEKSKKLVTNFPTLVIRRGTKTEILGVGYFTKEQILPKIDAFLAE